RPQRVVGFQQLSAVVGVARSFEQTLACGARFLVLAARVADIPEAPKRRNPLRGIVQLFHQITRAQIEIFHPVALAPFRAFMVWPIWMQMLSSASRVSLPHGSAFTFSSAAAKNSTASRLAERAAALAAASRR